MPGAPRADLWRLHRHQPLFVFGFIAFLLLMHSAERNGLSRDWIGPIFLFLSIMLYACIGIYSRTTDPEDFYVAGRTVTPWRNASAIGGEYISAASYLGVAGLVYDRGVDTLWMPVGYTVGYLVLLILVDPLQ